MTSMKDLFPLHGRRHPEKNFIKDNIQRVKIRSRINVNKHDLKSNAGNVQEKQVRFKKECIQSPSVKYVACSTKEPSLKCNVKIRSKTSSVLDEEVGRLHFPDINDEKTYKNQSSQTEDAYINYLICKNCQACDTSVNQKSASLQTDDEKEGSSIVSAVLKESDQKLTGTKTVPKENIPVKSDSVLIPVNYKIGAVPRYLKERNAKLQHEMKENKEREKLEEQLGIRDPDCPPGHMLMPLGERAQRLKELQREFDSLIKELNMMPVSCDSLRIRQRKIDIEKKLDLLENSIDTLKKDKVFVKLDKNLISVS